MGRCKRDWTPDKFERYVKEGRGIGQGESYLPWLAKEQARVWSKPVGDIQKISPHPERLRVRLNQLLLTLVQFCYSDWA